MLPSFLFDSHCEKFIILFDKITQLNIISFDQTGGGKPLFLILLVFRQCGEAFYRDIRRLFVDFVIHGTFVRHFKRIQNQHRHRGDGRAEDVVAFFTESGVSGFAESPKNAVSPEKCNLCQRINPQSRPKCNVRRFKSKRDLFNLNLGVRLSVTDLLLFVFL